MIAKNSILIGILSLISEELRPNKVIAITFEGNKFDVFSKVASHVHRGGNINLVGNEIILSSKEKLLYE